MNRSKRWLAGLLCCMLLAVWGPVQAGSTIPQAMWVLDAWAETYPVDAWGESSNPDQLTEEDWLPGGQERMVWVTGWILLTMGVYGDECQLIWDGQVPGLTVSGEIGRDWGDNTGYPDECFTESGDLRIRCGFPVTMAQDADAAQLIYRFLTECNPRLVITNERSHTQCEYMPEFGILVQPQEAQGSEAFIFDEEEPPELEWRYLTIDELTMAHVAAMENRLPTEGIRVQIKEIAELNDSDLREEYSDWLSKELIYGNRCWKIVFQLEMPQDCPVRLAAPFVRNFDWDLFLYGTQEKPLFFLADLEFARVDDEGRFTGYLTTRVDDLTIGSLYDWLYSMDFGFLLSTEPLMVVEHTFVNAWTGIGWLE